MRPINHAHRLKSILWCLTALLLTACAIPADPAPEMTSLTPTDTPPARTAITMAPAATAPAASSAQANADVTYVVAQETSPGTWTFSVTVEHPDTGWEDYADGWDVVLPSGEVVYPNPHNAFTRLLLHPHVEEQPFTRSASGIVIPADVTTVTVRAHDLVDGWGGATVAVDLTQPTGEGFEVVR